MTRTTENHADCEIGQRTVVLKFGGSVLREDRDVAGVVDEIYRWLRAGHKVLAVVSAIEGQTDALLARAGQFGPGASDSAAAVLLATGELQSAALLGLALGRAGIDASVLPISAIGLRTLGDVLDAEPVSADIARLRSALERSSVIVVPGFTGIGTGGQWTLLGRGGSDLTALFLAQQLGATCRLIKDVDGLYEWDPARPRTSADGASLVHPRKYARISIDDALTLGGHIVQNKALRFVREHDVSFEVGTFAVPDATIVTTDGPSALLDDLPPVASAPLRVALLGYGTVGQGVAKLLALQPARFSLCALAVRDIAKAARTGADPAWLTTDLDAAIRGRVSADRAGAHTQSAPQIVIETIGGIEPARRAISAALRAGIHVITANKAVIAAHGPALRKLAAQRGVLLAYSAAVGGAATVLETAAHLRRASLVRGRDHAIASIQGVLNGTTNFILDRVLAGGVDEETFAHAVIAAQQAGFAEADPTRDLDGHDVADKLVLLAHAAFGVTIDADRVQRQPLSAQAINDALERASPGQQPRYVGWLRREGRQIHAGVGVKLVTLDHPLSAVRGEHNRVIFELANGTTVQTAGRGAGRWPTAQAVIADAQDIWRQERPRERGTEASRHREASEGRSRFATRVFSA
jgi:homoserine dehydrogenase